MIIWGGLSVCTGMHRSPQLFSLPELHLSERFYEKVRVYAYILKIRLTIAFSYFGALCIRFFLGFVEAAFFPGALVSVPRIRSMCGSMLMLYLGIPLSFYSRNGTNKANCRSEQLCWPLESF